jgi:hypothetical protein
MAIVSGLILATGALLVGGVPGGLNKDDEKPLFRTGRLAVWQRTLDSPALPEGLKVYLYLLRGGIHRGLNFRRPSAASDRGDPEKDFSRMAATYHHRLGPVGRVMEKFNWFPDANSHNTFAADFRIPASLIGVGAPTAPFANFPGGPLVGLWAERPVAVVGLEVGEMASYARPGQFFDIYEHDRGVVQLSLPPKGDPYFWYVHDARARGANIRLFVGPERRMLAQKGPEAFYQVIVVEISRRDRLEDLGVDLMTRQGMTLLFDKLARRGVVCYHISNQFLNLSPILTDVADGLGYAVLDGSDMAPERSEGHFSSNWLMVARKREYLDFLKEPEGYAEQMQNRWGYQRPYWTVPVGTANRKYAWTDKSRHSLSGLWFSYGHDPATSRVDRISQDLVGAYLEYINKKPGGHKVPPQVIQQIRGLHLCDRTLGPVIMFLRRLTDQTAEELQEGYVKKAN